MKSKRRRTAGPPRGIGKEESKQRRIEISRQEPQLGVDIPDREQDEQGREEARQQLLLLLMELLACLQRELAGSWSGWERLQMEFTN